MPNPEMPNQDALEQGLLNQGLSNQYVSNRDGVDPEDAPIYLIPGAIADLFIDVTRSSTIKLADRYGLLAAMFDEALDEDERQAIDRLLRAIKRGKVKVVDDLSEIIH